MQLLAAGSCSGPTLGTAWSGSGSSWRRPSCEITRILPVQTWPRQPWWIRHPPVRECSRILAVQTRPRSAMSLRPVPVRDCSQILAVQTWPRQVVWIRRPTKISKMREFSQSLAMMVLSLLLQLAGRLAHRRQPHRRSRVGHVAVRSIDASGYKAEALDFLSQISTYSHSRKV